MIASYETEELWAGVANTSLMVSFFLVLALLGFGLLHQRGKKK